MMKSIDLLTPFHNRSTPFCIELLIDHLRSANGVLRLKAREALVKTGKPAVPYIIPLLDHANELVRWEACKTMQGIRDPNTAQSLALMLLDENMDVRWVAADALIELEHHGIIPLLELIEEHFDSPTLREAAHHVLHSLKEKKLLDHMEEEVLAALKVNELPSKAAFIANHALEHLRSVRPVRRRHIVL